ncbi:unnamed protein product [Protopolystoma xenopodis]|uniref:Uncharacterized protein n=1 Tax=Protopolystoma xenopodis TaxID=117903 RepID=A0A448XNB1_9PLAT|nr:unnamed protein product [Protopolystoma xenopodis]
MRLIWWETGAGLPVLGGSADPELDEGLLGNMRPTVRRTLPRGRDKCSSLDCGSPPESQLSGRMSSREAVALSDSCIQARARHQHCCLPVSAHFCGPSSSAIISACYTLIQSRIFSTKVHIRLLPIPLDDKPSYRPGVADALDYFQLLYRVILTQRLIDQRMKFHLVTNTCVNKSTALQLNGHRLTAVWSIPRWAGCIM